MYSCLVAAVLFYTNALKEGYYISHDLAQKYDIKGLQVSDYSCSSLVDYNDGQLSSFLEGLPLLTFVAALFVLIRKFISQFTNDITTHLIYYLLFGFGYIFYLHGPGVIFVYMMITANFVLTQMFAGKNGFPILIWIINLAFLIMVEYYNGFKFGWISPELRFLDKNIFMQWHRSNNLCMLKIISFALDYHWSIRNVIYLPKEKHIQKCVECSDEIDCLKFRSEKHQDDYSLLAFIAYISYPPLYLAGPTTSYNA